MESPENDAVLLERLAAAGWEVVEHDSQGLCGAIYLEESVVYYWWGKLDDEPAFLPDGWCWCRDLVAYADSPHPFSPHGRVGSIEVLAEVLLKVLGTPPAPQKLGQVVLRVTYEKSVSDLPSDDEIGFASVRNPRGGSLVPLPPRVVGDAFLAWREENVESEVVSVEEAIEIGVDFPGEIWGITFSRGGWANWENGTTLTFTLHIDGEPEDVVAVNHGIRTRLGVGGKQITLGGGR